MGDVEYIKEKVSVQLNQKTYHCEQIVEEQSEEASVQWVVSDFTRYTKRRIDTPTFDIHENCYEDSQTNKSMEVYYPLDSQHDLFPAGYWNGNAKP